MPLGERKYASDYEDLGIDENAMDTTLLGNYPVLDLPYKVIESLCSLLDSLLFTVLSAVNGSVIDIGGDAAGRGLGRRAGAVSEAQERTRVPTKRRAKSALALACCSFRRAA